MSQARSLKNLFRFIVASAGVVLIASIAIFAQSDNGSITGTVHDQNGAVVPAASITAKNQRTGEERTTTSNTDGSFAIPALKASAYTVTAASTGLGATVKDIEVNVGRETSLIIGMKIGDVTASVSVVAGNESTITTGSAAMGANVNPREVEALPLNGRQLSQLYLQAPGSVNSGSGTYGDIRFSGRAVEQNEIRYDGIEGTAIIDTSPGNLNGEVPTPFDSNRRSRTCRNFGLIRTTIQPILEPVQVARSA